MNKYNPHIHHRRSIRLKGYDYAQAGLYFITICVQNRECLFGEIENGEMKLNDAGKMIETEWLNLKNRFPNIELNEFITMPNHFHGILQIVGATLVVAQNTNVQNDVVARNTNAPNDVVAQNTNAPNDVVAQNTNAQNDNNENEKGQPQGFAPTTATTATRATTATAKTIGDMMDAFKSITTVEYIRAVKNLGWQPFNGKLWQRNYYEHIIRDEQSFQTISNYIINNPMNWGKDKLYV